MRKIGVLILAVVAAMTAYFCDDKGSGDRLGYSDLSGVWDFIFSERVESPGTFTVSVETGGGSGTAKASITGPLWFDTVTVFAGTSIDLGGCGAKVSFGDTPGFNLVAGDAWTIAFTGSVPGDPVPVGAVLSTVGLVQSSGFHLCQSGSCDGSVLAGAVNGPSLGLEMNMGQNGYLYSVDIEQSSNSISAVIPEQHALSLYLTQPVIGVGDTITLSYRRSVSADGDGGDFFRVIAQNGADNLDLEYLRGDAMSSGDREVSLTFAASYPFIRVDFIAGLSEVGESAVVDQVSLAVAGTTVFTEGFEAGPGGGCWPAAPLAALFEARGPDWEVGSLCVSANGALEGSYSARFAGGARRGMKGMIISMEGKTGLEDVVDGRTAGYLPDLAIYNFQIWEANYTDFYTSFAATEQWPGSAAGIFTGLSKDGNCEEKGEFLAGRHETDGSDFSEDFWTLTFSGDAVACDPPLGAGEDPGFKLELTTATGDTITVEQSGIIFQSSLTDSPADQHGNNYFFTGMVRSDFMTVSFIVNGGEAAAAGLGVIYEGNILGKLEGSLVLDGGRVCEIDEGKFEGVTVAKP